MANRLAVLALFFLITFTLSTEAQIPGHAWQAAKGKAEEKFATGELLVKFRRTRLSRAATVHAAVGAKALRNFQLVEGLQLVRVSADTTVQFALRAYRSSADVEYAEPNFIVSVSAMPDDPLLSEQWALSNPGGAHAKEEADIAAVKAWTVTTGNANVVVAVIDSGVDYRHPDLAANIFTNSADCNSNGIDDDGDGYADDCHGINASSRTSDPMDDFGHGTHVAGIIGAVGNNGLGVAGTNWNVQILPCKFLDNRGYGTVAGAIECLNYVKTLKDRGVNIVATNNSWGGFTNSSALNEAIAAQRDSGILFVAAAGNEFSSNDYIPVYPASVSYSNVISVAATTRLDTLADFSNSGRRTVHLGAPGNDILSTLPSAGYGMGSGTSMAAPFVTGAIALLKAQDPSRDWKQLKNLVLAGGDVVQELSPTITGRRLNAFGALSCDSASVRSRISPVDSLAGITVGTPLTIKYMDFDCATPAAELRASVSETGQLFTLKDDGVWPDETAGDGILTASWIPSTIGSYTINVEGADSFRVEALIPYVMLEKTSSYRTISGTSLDLGDDDVATLSAPFPISFGGSEFNQLYVSSNGTISLSNGFKEFYNRAIPITPSLMWDALWNSYQTTSLIAPWWDDLYPVKGTQQNVFWEVTGTAPARELVIEWRNVRLFDCHANPDSNVSFEAVFQEGSNDVVFEYGNTDAPNCSSQTQGQSATVGLQTSGAQGVQWSYYSPFIQSGKSLRFLLNTEQLPPNPLPKVTALVPNHAAYGGNSDMTLIVQGENFVPGSEVLWGGDRRATVYVSPTELHATITWFDLSVTNLVQVSVKNLPPGGGTSNSMPFGVGGEPPYITSITPSTIAAGSGDFDLTIKGSGFVQGQGHIIFGESLRQTTSVTSTEIHAKILSSDVAKAGTYKVMAYGFAGFASNQVDFTVTGAVPSQIFNDGRSNVPNESRRLPMKFRGWSSHVLAQPDYAKWFVRERAQSSPASATTQPQALSSPALPPGSSVPGVRLNPSIPAGFIPTGIVAADFNHDGHIDWAVSNGGDDTIYVYFGRGDGNCDPAMIIPLRGVSPVVMVGADLRKNGNTDLVLAEIDSGTVGVVLSNGDGTFEPETLHYVHGPIYTVNVADFNFDGIPDILYGINNFYSTPYTVNLVYFPGLGNGDFAPPHLQPPTTFWSSVAYSTTLADLTNTGVLDVISTDAPNGVVVYENNNGTLKTTGHVLALGDNSAVGDLDEDGCPDVVSVTWLGIADVSFGRCDRTFETRSMRSWGLGERTYALRLADVNGDGHLDVVSGGVLDGGGVGYGGANGGLVSVMLGDGKGRFDYPRLYPAQQGMFDLAVVDVNHDGKPDIITANQDSDSITLLLNDGRGGFGASVGQYTGVVRDGNTGAVNDPIGSPLVFDINGDGRLDIFLFSINPYVGADYPVITVLNQGDGHFSDPIRRPFLAPGYIYPFDYAVADFRNTGRLDVLISMNGLNGDGQYVFAANQGDGTFKAGTKTAVNASMARMAAGDFDGDGTIDVVMLGSPSSFIFLHSNGDGTFTSRTAGTLPSTGIAPFMGNVIATDLNHDGKLDLVAHTNYNVVPYNNHAVLTFLGNGDGTFQAGQIVIPNAGKVTYADVNRDGRLDAIDATDGLASAPLYSQQSPEYLVYFGQPDGSLALAATYDQYKLSSSVSLLRDALASGKFDSAYADYDGDSFSDIAAVQETGSYPRRGLVHFMKGLSDGKFVPNFTTYSLGNYGTSGPFWSADFDGDGKNDMLEYDGYTSSFHILPGIDGKKLDATLLVNPVKGTEGTLRVVLAAPSTSAVPISISVSDSNISIPAEVTVPAETAYLDVPFTIGSGFDMNRQFKITARLGNEAADAYGTRVSQTSPVGFVVSTYMGYVSGIPGGDSSSQATFVYSIAGYSGRIALGCAELPVGASCTFVNPEFDLQKGGSATTNTAVRIGPDVAPGTYNFRLLASDGVSTASTPLTLTVGDFSISAPKPYVELLPGGKGSTNLAILADGPTTSIVLNCSIADSIGTCSIAQGIFATQVNVQVKNVALGSYPVTVTATSGNVTRTLNLTLHVVDIAATFSATTLNMKPGMNTTVTVHLTASDLLLDSTVTLMCSTSQNISCADGYVHFPGTASTDSTIYFIVSYGYPLTVARAERSRHHDWNGFPFIVFAVLPLGICFIASSKRKIIIGAILTVVAVAMLGLSCGGGGSNGPSPGGGGGGAGGGNPLPVVKTEVFTITYVAPNFTKTLGTITVNVSK